MLSPSHFDAPPNLPSQPSLASIQSPAAANPALLESNFASAFQYAAIGMALVSLRGTFLQVNRALCELSGYTEDELRSLTFQDITHTDDLNKDLAFLGQLLRGEISSYRMEKRYFHQQGHIIWILLSVSLVSDASGNPCHFVSQIQDITERRHVEQQLLSSQREFQTLIENVPDIIARYDTNLRVLYLNSSFERITGRTTKTFAGRTLEEADVPSPICDVHREAMNEVIATRQIVRTEYHYQSHRGSLYFQMRMVPEFDSHDQIVSVLCVSHDVTQFRETQCELLRVQKQLEETNAALAHQNDKLEILAHYDSLTSVPNRRAFDIRLSEEIAGALRQGLPFCLALLDIDHFKRFNDTFGHGIGDQTLQEVARILESTLRPSDVVARYGGEEFALIFTHTDPQGGMMAAERCRSAVDAFAWPHHAVTVSVGVAHWAGQDSDTLLAQADLALYGAKQAGRNRVQLSKT